MSTDPKIRIVWGLVALVAAVLSPGVVAEASPPESVVLETDSLPESLSEHFQYLVDAESELDLEAVRSTRDSEWRAIDNNTANFGFSEATYWLRGDLRGGSSGHESWLLELAYPLLDYVDVFVVRKGELAEHYATGDRLPFSNRPIRHRNFLFPVSLADGESVRVYIRVRTSSALQVPLNVTTHETLVQTEQTHLMAHAMYFGIVGVMMLYNLFILFSIRDRAYLFYVLFVFALGGFQLALHGFGYQFVWSGSPWMQNKIVGTFTTMASLWGSWFTLVFLNVRAHSVVLSRILWTFVAFGGVLTLLSPFVPYASIVFFTSTLALATAIVCQITGLYIWYRGYKPAAHYSLAFAAVLLGTAMMVLNRFALVPVNAVTENGQQIGSLLQLVLLSLALAYRIKVLRDETEEAQLEATTRLERRVSERTAELEEVNRRLQQLSSLDPLTGTYNRRYLDDHLRAEWSRAQRERYPISVIMLDIDYFKSFNDRHGHSVGDECLRFLARNLLGCVYRTPDIVVRYGGEEFAIVLPCTESRGAEAIARRIREVLSEHPFPVGRGKTRITVSQGIATLIPGPDEAPEKVVQYADEALYRAKEAGRDCFRHHAST